MRVVAMAVFATTFASPTMWAHYLAPMVPLILVAWAPCGPRRRVVLALFVITSLGLWVGLNSQAWFTLAYDGVLIACCLSIAMVVPDQSPGYPGEDRTAFPTAPHGGLAAMAPSGPSPAS